MKIDFLFHPRGPLRELISFAKLVEEQGFEHLWIAEETPVPNYNDIWVSLTAVALSTETVTVGTGIAIPYHYHPVLMAVAFSNLDEATGGRIVVGLGSGGTQPLRPLGVEVWHKPLATMKESMEIIRRLFAGETLDYEGEVFKARRVRLASIPKKRIPIYLAARGPRMLRLAGEAADGVVMQVPIKVLDWALERVGEGASRVGRRLKDLDVANVSTFSVSRDAKRGKEHVKAKLSWMLPDSPPLFRERMGVTEAQVERMRESLKEGPTEAAKWVTEKMIDEFSITGTPSQCIRGIEEFENAGLKHLIISADPEPSETLKLIGEEILPSFK